MSVGEDRAVLFRKIGYAVGFSLFRILTISHWFLPNAFTKQFQVRHARSSSCPHIAELAIFRRPDQRTKSICARELMQNKWSHTSIHTSTCLSNFLRFSLFYTRFVHTYPYSHSTHRTGQKSCTFHEELRRLESSPPHFWFCRRVIFPQGCSRFCSVQFVTRPIARHESPNLKAISAKSSLGTIIRVAIPTWDLHFHYLALFCTVLNCGSTWKFLG